MRKLNTVLLAIVAMWSAAQLHAQNMNRYITLAVKKGEAIELHFAAATANTPIRIVSGSTDQTIAVGTDWTDRLRFTAAAATMTIYGDLTDFRCDANGENLTAIDASRNTALTGLFCSSNRLTTLDLSKNTALKNLTCFLNQLTTLDLSHNPALRHLFCSGNRLTRLDLSRNPALARLICYDNELTALDLSRNPALTILKCDHNQLSTLDVGHNPALTELVCRANRLTTLDVSRNTALKYLACDENPFTTQRFNDLMCSLPVRDPADKAIFRPIFDTSDSIAKAFMASDAQIARNKHWQVNYHFDKREIITTGSYNCPMADCIDAVAAVRTTLYPNPVHDLLHIGTAGEVKSVHIYTAAGTEVAKAAGTTAMRIAHLPAGLYLVRVATDQGIHTQPIIKR